jgi:hypothetical protein
MDKQVRQEKLVKRELPVRPVVPQPMSPSAKCQAEQVVLGGKVARER